MKVKTIVSETDLPRFSSTPLDTIIPCKKCKMPSMVLKATDRIDAQGKPCMSCDYILAYYACSECKTEIQVRVKHALRKCTSL